MHSRAIFFVSLQTGSDGVVEGRLSFTVSFDIVLEVVEECCYQHRSTLYLLSLQHRPNRARTYLQ